MPKTALTTFLRVWNLEPGRKESQYRQFLSPGGYDFYWSLKAGTETLTNGGDLATALSVTDGLSREPERKHNRYGIKTVAELLAGVEGKCFKAPRGSVSSPLGHLTIKIEPELGIELDGRRRLVTLWNPLTPEMTTALAAVGFSLMFDALVHDEFKDCSCAIYDLRQKRWHMADAPSATMRSAVRRELDWVDSLFEKFRSEKGAPRDKGRPVPPSP